MQFLFVYRLLQMIGFNLARWWLHVIIGCLLQSAERIKTTKKFVIGNTVLAFNPATYIEVRGFSSHLSVVHHN